MRHIVLSSALLISAFSACAADLPSYPSNARLPASHESIKDTARAAAMKSWKISLAPLVASQALDGRGHLPARRATFAPEIHQYRPLGQKDLLVEPGIRELGCAITANSYTCGSIIFWTSDLPIAPTRCSTT